MNNLIVVTCCDTEPNRQMYGGKEWNWFGNQEWKGIKRGIQQTEKIKEELKTRFDHDVKISWFIRSDTNIEMIYGRAGWALERFEETWQRLLSLGDEIGWHPHTWRWSYQNKCWFQEVNDIEWMLDCLEAGFRDFADVMNFKPTSARMGWGFHHNATMQKLNDLGMIVDLSAMPRVKLKGGPGDKTVFEGYCNWENTPENPYFPSRKDYRVPEKDNTRALKLLEMPITVYSMSIQLSVRFPWYFGRFFYLRTFGRSIKLVKPFFSRLRFLNTTENSSIFRYAVEKVLKRSKKSENMCYLASFFHIDELLDYLNTMNLRTNLATIMSLARKYSVDINFITATEAAKCFIDYSR